ncbi:MAG: agmatine deiminase family protein [Deltaproteobacteria bacterium]|nr:agmatine deiminase family protein [Deltaproteobacteria bacterium]
MQHAWVALPRTRRSIAFFGVLACVGAAAYARPASLLAAAPGTSPNTSSSVAHAIPSSTARDATRNRKATDPPPEEIAPRLILLGTRPSLGGHVVPGERRHRGDWEPPNTVVFAYASAWPNTLRTMVRATSAESEVVVLVTADDHERALRWYERSRFDAKRVKLVETSIESPWVRDYGPLQVYNENGRLELLDADYAPDRPGDDEIPLVLASQLRLPLRRLPFGIDGGALISNGRGLCLMTLDSYYESGAPELPGPERDELMNQLGCQILALVPALEGEPTGHIDMVAQFLGPDVIAVAEVDARRWRSHYLRLAQVVEGVKLAAEAIGMTVRVERVPMPVLSKSRFRTYLNGLPLAHTYLVPRYRDVPRAEQDAALRALALAMPRVKLKPIDADRMISLDGAVHCLSLGMSIDPR